MTKILTPNQVTAVAEVQASINAAAALRVQNKVVETPDQTAARVAAEAFDLRVAEGSVSKHEMFHQEARKQRVHFAISSIASARLKRKAQALAGIEETKGATEDRIAAESLILAQADLLNVIEPVTIDSNDSQVTLLAAKTNEIVTYLNLTASVMGITASVLTAAMVPVLSSVLAKAASIVSVASVLGEPSVLSA